MRISRTKRRAAARKAARIRVRNKAKRRAAARRAARTRRTKRISTAKKAIIKKTPI